MSASTRTAQPCSAASIPCARNEPWPGYDELTVDEIKKTLARADAKQSREVREYERRHKERRGSPADS